MFVLFNQLQKKRLIKYLQNNSLIGKTINNEKHKYIQAYKKVRDHVLN